LIALVESSGARLIDEGEMSPRWLPQQSSRSLSWRDYDSGDLVARVEWTGGAARLCRVLGEVTPLYFAPAAPGGIFVGDDLDGVARVAEASGVEESCLVEFLLFGTNASGVTPFTSVGEVLPGRTCILDMRSGTVTGVNREPVCSRSDDFTAALRQEVRRVAADATLWVELSGGLDSALVALVAAETLGAERVRALHQHHPVPAAADELEHAQYVADALGISLEVLSGPEVGPYAVPSLSVGPRPTTQLAVAGWHHAVAATTSTDPVVDGHGGDQLFLADQGSPTLALSSLSPSSIRVGLAEACAYADRTGGALLPALVAGALAPMRRRRMFTNGISAAWLALPEHCQRAVKRARRRTLSAGEAPSVSRLREIELVVAANDAGSPREPAHLLLSPRVVAASLTVPIGDWTRKGVDRCPIRSVLAERLPGIASRLHKADYAGVFVLAAAEHHEMLAELLATGALAERGWIKRDGVRNAVDTVALGRCDDLWPLNRAIALERWLSCRGPSLKGPL